MRIKFVGEGQGTWQMAVKISMHLDKTQRIYSD